MNHSDNYYLFLIKEPRKNNRLDKMNNTQKTNRLIKMTGSNIRLDTLAIKNNHQMTVKYLAHIRPIYRWNSETKQNEPIIRLTDSKHSYFMTINPEWTGLNESQVKDLFNFIKNRYAQFVYGRKWTTQFNYKYDGVVETPEDKSTHLHINFYDLSLNEMSLMYNFFCEMTHAIYPRYLTKDTRFNCKIIDETSSRINMFNLLTNPLYNQLTKEEKAQITKGLTTQQIGQLNTFNYMTKQNYIYFTNDDFIKSRN